jgi:hypothetical protein
MRDRTAFPLDITAHRGRLMAPAQIRTEIFADAVSLWWVRKNVAPRDKITLGRSTVRWYEFDVYRWLDERKGR